MPRVDLLGVTGNPILHSLSPQMCRAGAAAAGLPLSCVRLAVDDAAEAMALARALGLRGLNVTSPFKEQMAALVDRLEPDARAVGAVNAVSFTRDGTVGHNTDAAGACAAMREMNADPFGSRAVVIGVGGAGRAAAHALQRGGAADVALLSRSEERSSRAAAQLGCRWAPWPRAGEEVRRADIVFLCLPRGAELPAGLSFRSGAFVIDANVSDDAPPREARRSGAACANGVSWLVEQCAASLERFLEARGSRPAMREVAASSGPRAWRRVTIVGASGAGKSEVARQLSILLGVPYLDTDRIAERVGGCTVAEIFARSGELEFRRLERQAASEAFGFEESIVALGAGALSDPATRAAVRARCLIVWLWVDAATSAARAAGAGRPLLDGPVPEPAAARLIRERTPSWARSADLVIDARVRAPEETARRIAHEIDRARSA
jgi:shikimate dehydrogenase